MATITPNIKRYNITTNTKRYNITVKVKYYSFSNAGGGGGTWGSITGTLAAQTDLQTQLNRIQTLIIDDNFTGTQNGSNLIFTTTQTYIANSTKIYLNGLRLKRGQDYNETGTNTTITFVQAPLSTDNIVMDYRTT